ncbi:MAG: HAMP domain-containing protein [Lentisphaerae bacterium]|nr:MAG: HAMP domain-containing protein [Lentisphaerota bacterium]
MSYKSKIILTIILIPVTAVIAVTTILGWYTRTMMLKQAETSGKGITRILEHAVDYADQVPVLAENAIALHMQASATILAHLVDIAENQAHLTPPQITQRLKQIAAATILDECWITDEKGHAYLHNIDNIDFTFSPDPQKQPQAHEFYQILTGQKKTVIQPLRKREIDNRHFKYVGVSGIDKPRIVEVGCHAPTILSMRQKIGLQTLIKKLVDGDRLLAVELVENNISILSYGIAYSSTSKQYHRTTIDAVQQAIASGQDIIIPRTNHLQIIHPYINQYSKRPLAIIAAISTRHVKNATRTFLSSAAQVAAITLVFSLIASLILAHQVSSPVTTLIQAATDLQQNSFDPQSIQKVARRPDELGQFARAFSEMALAIQKREQILQQQVEELQIQIDHRKKDEEVKKIVESDYFQDILSRADELKAERRQS